MNRPLTNKEIKKEFDKLSLKEQNEILIKTLKQVLEIKGNTLEYAIGRFMGFQSKQINSK